MKSMGWLALALLAACSKESEPARSAEPAGQEEHQIDLWNMPAPDATKPYIVTRDHELWVLPGMGKDRYTVKSRDGKVLADRIDEAHLRRDYSYLHNRLHPEYMDFYQWIDD